MTVEELYQGLTNTGLEVAYYQFEEGDVPALPYLIYYFRNTDDFFADNSNYVGRPLLYVELYTERKDFETEALVDEALKNMGLTYEKEESFIESENMYEVLYIMEVIING